MALARLPPIGSQKAQEISPRRMVKYDGLNGPTYSLGNSSPKFNLPQPKVLRPYKDTSAGALETWPAHATGQAHSGPSASLNKNKQLVLMDDESVGKPQMVPKPGFLSQLETFLKKELRSLGVDRVEPNELRLQAYREVFEYLIEDFKTYKPLLSAIKNEYEMMLAQQREQIRQMEPLKQMLVTVSEQCDQKIMALRDQEKQDTLDLKSENKRLYKRIDELRQDQLSLQSQVERMQEELAAEYLRYRDECDARRLLVNDMNELRNQQEDLIMSQKPPDEEGEQDDPITLKIALKIARRDECAATKRLNEMIANYGDVIPRRDFEQLTKDHAKLLDDDEQRKADYTKLKQEHEILLKQYEMVLQQRDNFYTELESRKENTTPRPSWDKCADVISGGFMRWKELSEGKTSDQLMYVLLEEIQGDQGEGGNTADFFDGQGLGEEIPKFLRYEGKIRNRRLGKRDTLLLIKDIWREKIVHDTEDPDATPAEPMSIFLYNYLQRRFGIDQMIFEWGYNLHDACQRYSHDENINQFWQVLCGEMDQSVYIDQLTLMTKLLNHLTKADVDGGHSGEIPKEEFKALLKSFFPGRDEENIILLTTAAETELGAKDFDTIDYRSLFMEDDEGKTGPFLDEYRTQYRGDRHAYVEDIRKQLGTTSPVTPEELKRAFLSVDPALDSSQVDTYLCWAYRVADVDRLIEAESCDQAQLMSRLMNGNIRRSAQSYYT